MQGFEKWGQNLKKILMEFFISLKISLKTSCGIIRVKNAYPLNQRFYEHLYVVDVKLNSRSINFLSCPKGGVWYLVFFILGRILRHFCNVLLQNNGNQEQNIAEMSQDEKTRYKIGPLVICYHEMWHSGSWYFGFTIFKCNVLESHF